MDYSTVKYTKEMDYKICGHPPPRQPILIHLTTPTLQIIRFVDTPPPNFNSSDITPSIETNWKKLLLPPQFQFIGSQLPQQILICFQLNAPPPPPAIIEKGPAQGINS